MYFLTFRRPRATNRRARGTRARPRGARKKKDFARIFAQMCGHVQIHIKYKPCWEYLTKSTHIKLNSIVWFRLEYQKEMRARRNGRKMPPKSTSNRTLFTLIYIYYFNDDSFARAEKKTVSRAARNRSRPWVVYM